MQELIVNSQHQIDQTLKRPKVSDIWAALEWCLKNNPVRGINVAQRTTIAVLLDENN